MLAQSQVLLTLTLQNAGSTPQPLDVSFEIPFVSRIYPEVEGGYESTSPTPLQPGPGSRDVSAWVFTRSLRGDAALQTAEDTGGTGVACTAAAVTAVNTATAGGVTSAGDGSRVGLSPVELTPAPGGAWSRAATTGTLQPGSTATIQIALAVASSCAGATASATQLSSSFASEWEAIPGNYEKRWQGAFNPDPNSDEFFSGNWPVLETDEAELSRTYLLRGVCIDNHFHILHVILGLNYRHMLLGSGIMGASCRCFW